MNIPDDMLPNRPLKRFCVGFGVAALATFIPVILYRDHLKDGVLNAGVAGVVVGLVAGLLSAFGKKILRCVLTMIAEVLSNP